MNLLLIFFIWFLGSQKSLLTRGQTLLMKSTSVNFPISQSRVDPVQFSQKFNIPLITTTELKKVLHAKVVNQRKKSSNDLGLIKLETSFIKVEDYSQSFLPFFKKFLNFHIKSKEISNVSSKKALKKNVTKEKFGYCECCDDYFNNLSLHRKTRRHMSFVTNDNFSSVDILIRGLPRLEDFCAPSGEGSSNSKVDKLELKEIGVDGICHSCPDQNKLKTPDNFNKTNLPSTQPSSIINTDCYYQRAIDNNVTSKSSTVATGNYGNKLLSCRDAECTASEDISHSSRAADTKPGISCLSLPNNQSKMQFKQMLVSQPHHCLIVGDQFENCNKASCQQDSTDLYTCRPLSCQNTINYDLKFIITKVARDVDAVTNSGNNSLETIPIQDIRRNSICNGSPRCFSAEPNSRRREEPHKLIFSNVCNELLQALPQKNDDNSMMSTTARKWIKAKRKCTKDNISNDGLKKKLQNVPVNSFRGCSISKFENPRNSEDILCNLPTTLHSKQHDKLNANHGMNMWSLKYTTDLKVIFTKISSL